MTETKWFTCDDPTAMLEFLRVRTSDRKLRLFACACCRRIWHLLTDERSRNSLEVAERFADRLAQEEELATAHRAASHDGAVGLLRGASGQRAAMAASGASLNKYKERSWWSRAASTSVNAVYAVSDTASVRNIEAGIQTSLLRCMFGPLLFRPVPIEASWRTPDVVALAEGAYTNRLLPSGEIDPTRLAVLSDALEEVGADSVLVEHLRGPGPHVRGCHVVDLLTRRE